MRLRLKPFCWSYCFPCFHSCSKNKLSPKWHYALWLLLIVKLSLFWLPGNLWSLFRWTPDSDVVQRVFNGADFNLHIPEIDKVYLKTSAVQHASFHPLDIGTIAALLWLSGALGHLMFLLFINIKMRIPCAHCSGYTSYVGFWNF